MKKINKIVLATDFSDSVQSATEYAKALKEQFNIPLAILHVFDEKGVEMPAPYYFIPEASTWLDVFIVKNKKRGKETLEELGKKLGENCQTHFLEGPPAQTIVDFVKENEVDLLIMGTHGYSGLKRIFMGSVAEYVMRHASCPVLTIKHSQKEEHEKTA